MYHDVYDAQKRIVKQRRNKITQEKSNQEMKEALKIKNLRFSCFSC